MKFTCWNEVCQIEVLCDCGLPCCSGHVMKPYIIDLDSQVEHYRLTEKEKMDLVLHHICPDCSGWVEC